MAKNKAKLQNAVRQLDRALELPAGTLSGGAHIELNSNREAVIDGCKGIIDYGEEAVRLNIGNGSVTFLGRSLMLKNLTDKQAILVGHIQRIEFDG